jgi:ParB family chromosome partitioning protein
MSEKKKSVLGRGLNALLEQNDTTDSVANKQAANIGVQAGVVINIPLELIEVNPFQPRTTFEEESLEDLANSIKIHGVIQPITVRKAEGNKYQLIAGERRLRASKKAGKKEVPAYVRNASDQESIEIALIENIQREDLNPLEIGINYKRLIDECDLTQEQLSERLGKNRSTVTNFLRLLRLPPDIQAGLRDEKISMGHAKAILAVDDVVAQIAAFKETIQKGLSVRQVEELVRGMNSKAKKTAPAATSTPVKKGVLPYTVKKMEDNMISALSTKVTVLRSTEGKGEIIIKFYSDNDLERIVETITGK